MRKRSSLDPSRCPIFEGISDEAIEELCSRGRELTWEANRVLFARGQQAEELDDPPGGGCRVAVSG